MRFSNFLNERQIFHDKPEEIASHFKAKYGARAMEKLRFWLEKYKKKSSDAGTGGYANELMTIIKNLSSAVSALNENVMNYVGHRPDEINKSQVVRVKQNLKYYRDEKKKLMDEYKQLGNDPSNSSKKSVIVKRVRELEAKIKQENEFAKGLK